MLKRMVEEALQEAVLSDWFTEYVGKIVRESVESPAFKRHVTAKIRKQVDEKREAVIVRLEEGDIIVFPGDLPDDVFAELSRMVPDGQRLGIVSADNVRILKFS